MFISEVLYLGENILKQQGIISYKIDALLLLCFSLECGKEQIIFSKKKEIDFDKQQNFFFLVRRRSNREPVSQIIGKREFFGIDFVVSKNVLDPRPDSETVVECILEYFTDRKSCLSFLELGLGSGCLLFSSLKHFPNSSGLGVDISDKALEIATKNLQLLDLSKRVNLLHSDWFSDIPPIKKFDLIISNPPYIKSEEIEFLQKEVKNFEPKIALDGGKDGLECYRLISEQVQNFLKRDGILVLEIGEKQENEVINIFKKMDLKLLSSKKDLSGIIRCLVFKLKNENIL